MVPRYLLATFLAFSVHLSVEWVAFAVAAEKAPSAKVQAPEPHHHEGWRFTMPKGDPAKGRAVFEKFECYDCHEVRWENFPYPTDIRTRAQSDGAATPGGVLCGVGDQSQRRRAQRLP